VSAKLRELMQQHLTALEQTGLMRDLNHAVQQGIADTHHATMVAVGFHGRRGLLVVTNAGHPPPIWYRAKREDWSWLEPPHRAQRSIAAGTPLGLLPDISYDRKIVKPLAGDLVVLYSDGVSEATNRNDEELGGDGLMALARRLGPRSAAAFGAALATAVQDFRGGTVANDDQTIIVMERVLPAIDTRSS
jgi:sigma-B regulation protein RsbU (phosphoserine phosphatase)